MRHLSAGRFLVLGIIASLLIGYLVFIAVDMIYPLSLSADDIATLVRNGTTVDAQSRQFGLMPAFWVTVALLAYVGNGYMKRRRSHVMASDQ